ncbi:bifunctional adenosylcobinamide kinase/adenosylcobinamide-phosphate guanylyltransferase [Ornithinimicrobium sp. Y1847]|uniref:bifunctional adenosylcobinamide kinase/adenosylcobinamide-phosphate guanylyltransferase n=1 Tax=unclassified Ornithinimicrobium TaxID=2615080 RepID=UPI003B684FB3
MTLTLLTGGARSGKSSVAVRRALRAEQEDGEREGRPVVFVATGQAGDEEMAARIALHQAERPAHWSTLEAPIDLDEAVASIEPGRTVIIDCLALWVSNLMGAGEDEPATLARAQALGRWAAAYRGAVIVVTNEVGSGIVPMHPVSRDYRDRLGRVNALISSRADLAQLVVAGRTLTLDPIEE